MNSPTTPGSTNLKPRPGESCLIRKNPMNKSNPQNQTSFRGSMLLLPATMAAALLLALTNLAGTANAGVTGAIFTTDSSGGVVNGNIYDHCCDVYLNGGPGPHAPCTAAGLPGDPDVPNGAYYFQVTDPSGAVLLSTDDISQRWVTVAGGVITAYNGDSSSPCTHLTFN